MQNILSVIVDMLYFVRKHKGEPVCSPLEKKQTVPLAQRGATRGSVACDDGTFMFPKECRKACNEVAEED